MCLADFPQRGPRQRVLAHAFEGNRLSTGLVRAGGAYSVGGVGRLYVRCWDSRGEVGSRQHVVLQRPRCT